MHRVNIRISSYEGTGTFYSQVRDTTRHPAQTVSRTCKVPVPSPQDILMLPLKHFAAQPFGSYAPLPLPASVQPIPYFGDAGTSVWIWSIWMDIKDLYEFCLYGFRAFV